MPKTKRELNTREGRFYEPPNNRFEKDAAKSAAPLEQTLGSALSS